MATFTGTRRRVTLTALSTFGAALGMAPMTAHAAGTTVYVDNANAACTDTATGAGGSATPFCTLQAAANSAQPGTTVLVEPGNGYTTGVMMQTNSGTPGSPIVFKAATSHVWVTNQFGPSQGVFDLSWPGLHDITVQGFDISGGTGVNARGNLGISVLDNHITAAGPSAGAGIFAGGVISGNTVTGPFAIGISAMGGPFDPANGPTAATLVDRNDVSGMIGSGVYLNGSDIQLSNNRIHDASQYGVNAGAAIGGYGADLIVNNLIYGNGGPGVSVTMGFTEYITSNTIVDNNGPQIDVNSTAYGPVPIFIADDILAVDGTMPSYSGAGGTVTSLPAAAIHSNVGLQGITDNVIDVPGGNVYEYGPEATPTGSALPQTAQRNIIGAAGLNADGSLKAGSPAIDSANSTADGVQATDFNHAKRVDDPATANTGVGTSTFYDRGALEFGGTAGKAPAPALAPPVLPHTDCGIMAVPSNPAAGNPTLTSLVSTDLPPIGASNPHNLLAGTPGVIHAKASGGTGGVACYEFVVDSQTLGTQGTQVVPADSQGNADLIVAGQSFGSQYVTVVAIDHAGRQTPEGMYQFYSVGSAGGVQESVHLTTAGVAGQPFALNVSATAYNMPAGHTYQFDFGDGTTIQSQTTSTASHTYAKAGMYAVEVRLIDASGVVQTEDAQYAWLPTNVPAPPSGPLGGGPGGGPGGGNPTPHPTGGQPGISRLFGQDRYGTSQAVSAAQWQPGAANAVVLATGANFPDALSGVPLAAHVHGPLLLTDSAALAPTTGNEISRVLGADKTKTVYILGGKTVVSQAVEDAVARLGYHVQRFGGADRYATSLQIAQSFGATPNVVVATGQNFPDALSAGPLAAANGSPIVLSQDSKLDSATASFVAAHATVDTVGVQAGAAVTKLSLGVGHAVSSHAGADRYITSREVAVAVDAVVAAGGHAPAGIGVASGMNFPDALTGGAFAANAGEPLLLTDPKTLPGVTGDFLQANSAMFQAVAIFGGPGAVSQGVENSIAARMNARIIS